MIAIAEYPAWPIRSGTSVSSVPDTVATSVITTSAASTRRLSRSVRASARNGTGSAASGAGGAARQATVRPAAARPSTMNGTFTP